MELSDENEYTKNSKNSQLAKHNLCKKLGRICAISKHISIRKIEIRYSGNFLYLYRKIFTDLLLYKDVFATAK